MAHQRAVHKFTNALIHETSPYLLQHAHNPVDWLPWGQEAFQKAKTEQKPIFLSIGYSTCHWCHVMERESFESEQTAQLMNKHFVNIKVDREERPDVDRVYMSFVQATTGGGGWPLNVFLTPNLAPFFGGTYFPPNDTMYSGTPGFPQLLLQISAMWKNDRAKLEKSGEKIIEALKSTSSRGSTSASASTAAESWLQDKDTIYDNVFQQAIDSFLQDFDRKFGGFGNAPKFPRPVILNFLFRMHYLSTVDKKNRLSKQTAEVILHSCLFTLEKMAQGGMYDQLGSGFHRYSVDKEWHVPHFEKMTYDQGQLICSYVEAYQVSKKNYFANIARNVIEYMTRDMMVSRPPTTQDKSNRDMIAFYSAEDADSYPTHDSDKKREGAFYAWSYNELKQLLSNEAVFGAEQESTTSKKNGSLFDLCKHVFGVEMNGNVKPRSDPHGEFRGLNILIQRCSIEEAAEQFGTSEQQIEEALGRAKSILMKERSKRPRPHLDDKIIVSWNALMISALARAAQVLSEEKYAQLGEQAARFIKNVLYNAQKKTLYRTYRRTESSSSDAPSGLIDGFLSDYCNMVSALLDLYEATANIEWLEWAMELQERQDELFLDQNNGGYFEVTGQDPSILLRMKEDYDGAEPSGNSISAMNLLRLSQYQTNKAAQILAQADKLFTSEHEMLNEMPVAVPQMLCALDERLNPGKHIAIVYNNEIGGRSALIDVQKTIFSHHIPSKSLFYVDLDDDKVMTFVKDNMPYLSEASIKNGKPTVYICQNFACQAPVTDLNELNKILVNA